MRSLGRVLQISGLTLPPVGLILQNLTRDAAGTPFISVKQMLAMLVVGVCLFLIGRLVEGYGR